MPIVQQIKPFDLTIADPLKRTQDFWDFLAAGGEAGTYGADFFAICRPTAARYENDGKQARVTFELDALPKHFCNGMNNLHGGAAATLLDIVTTAAIAPLSAPGKFRFGGVSRTLACGYARGLPVGARATIVCETVNVGARLCLISAKVYDDEGRVCVTCEHHKASVDPPGFKL